jgi:D-glycero-D-manno-heptose 1,7-bisphosphate phosphatase
MSGAVRRAVFLDRDGVLNRPVVRSGKPYPPAALDEFEILPDAFEGVELLRKLGFWLFVVTNQPDVARGAQQRSVVEAMHDKLRDALQLKYFYVCYHDDGDACDCRKPKPGLLFEAAAQHNISLPDSYMIGDRWRDIDCGHAAACKTIFIDRGYAEKLRTQPEFRVPDLRSAAGVVISREEHSYSL